MTEVLAALFSITFAQQALRIAIPYVLGAIGATITERSGTVDLAVEAKLLFGAFAAAAVAYSSGSILLGVVAGAGAGALVGVVQAALTIGLRADHVIVGIGLNMVALAGTRYLLQLVYGQGTSSEIFPGMGDALLANPTFWIAIAATVAVAWALVRTRGGLRVRAAGDRPDALRAAGVSVARVRYGAAALGGTLAGIGGSQLSLAVGVFDSDMTGGRGYICLAAVILANWRPGRAALACLLFAAADAANYQFQILATAVPRELAPILPPLVTLVVLAGVGGGRRPPAALGRTDA